MYDLILQIQRECFLIQKWKACPFPLDTGRKVNVYKTFRRHPRRVLCDQFTKNFAKNQHFFCPSTHTYVHVYHGLRNVSFSENFGK